MSDTKKYDCLLDLVKERRTIRQFRPDLVVDEDITRILQVASWALSGFHTQPWEFVMVKDKAVRQKIIDVLEEHGPPIKGSSARQPEPKDSYWDAPVFIIVLCDWWARVGLSEKHQGNNARIAQIFDSSLAGVFVYMHLAATVLGLSLQWCSATSEPKTEPAIREIIGIPEALSIYDMMVLGYEAHTTIPKAVRDLDSMMHYDACGQQDLRIDDEVLAYAEKAKAWCLAAR